MIKYPYTDFHEMNLDWFITTFKELLEEWDTQKQEFEDLNEAWNTLKDYVDHYFDNLDVQTEINNKLDDMAESGELADILGPLLSGFESEYNSRLDVLTARMDAFASLAEGSTTGDAELMDIRVGADGVTYASAGDAVREQFDHVNNAVNRLGVSDGIIPIGLRRGYHNQVNGVVNEGTTPGTVALRATGITALYPDVCPPGTVIICKNTLTVRAWYCTTGDVLVGYSDPFAATLVIPATYNGTPYDYLYLDFKNSDNTVTDINTNDLIMYYPDGWREEWDTCNSKMVTFMGNGVTIKQNGTGVDVVVPAETRAVNTKSGDVITIPAGTYNIDPLPSSYIDFIYWDGAAFTVSSNSGAVSAQLNNPYYLVGVYFPPIDSCMYNVLSVPEAPHGVVIQGPLFIWYANSNIHIQTGLDTRVMIERTFISSGTDTDTVLPLPTNACYYVCMDVSGTWYLKRYDRITEYDYTFAIYYNNEIRYAVHGVIINTLPLLPVYVRQDVPLYINGPRLGFNVKGPHIIATNGSAELFKDTLKLTNANGASLYMDTDSTVVRMAPKNRSVHLNTVSLSSESILMVGTSITNRGWIQQRIHDYAPGVSFVGSYNTGIGTGYAGYMCEAYPGARAVDMISAGGAHSRINGNYANYVNTYLNGSAPDIVTIEFGLNEVDADSYRNNIQDLIDMIKTYDTANNHTTKIYVLVPFERNLTSNMGKTYTFERTQLYAGRRIILEAAELTDCVLIPTHMILDDRYDYTHSDDSTEYGFGVTMDIVTDYVHPSQNVGFKKLGDIVYSYLGL